MKAVYTRLTRLLGQPLHGIIFDRFVAEFGDEPIIEPAACTFPTLGVTLIFLDELFCTILIHIDTPSTQEGKVSRYGGDLPNGIELADGPEIIEKKLCVRPFITGRPSITGFHHKEFKDTYQLPPLVLVFEFSTNPERLSCVAIGKSSDPIWAGNS